MDRQKTRFTGSKNDTMFYLDHGTPRNGRQRKTGAAKRQPHRTKRRVYQGIGDFLNRVPIATASEYGERVLIGQRIC